MRLIFTAVALLALPVFAFALATESFGNAPVVRQPEWSNGVLETINLKSRVYSIWINGNENFFFRGNRAALAEALQRYAAIDGQVHEVVILPGPGTTQSLDGKKIDFDWQLHVPSGIYKAMTKRKDVVLTVHINVAASDRPLNRERVDTWITDLDSDKFQVREKAAQELEKLGDDVRQILRDALKGRAKTPEGRRRVEVLLDKLRGIACLISISQNRSS
jgi:hypothetical protein